MKRILILMATVMALGAFLLPSTASAQQPLVVTALAEKKVAELPPGELFWRVETFPTLAQAQAAAGTWALVAESAGKVWLFTLGPAGGAPAGGGKVAEVGPIPRVTAPEYLLRYNEARGPQVRVTPVHLDAVSEAFFVVAGEQIFLSAHVVQVV